MHISLNTNLIEIMLSFYFIAITLTSVTYQQLSSIVFATTHTSSSNSTTLTSNLIVATLTSISIPTTITSARHSLHLHTHLTWWVPHSLPHFFCLTLKVRVFSDWSMDWSACACGACDFLSKIYPLLYPLHVEVIEQER